MAVYRRIYRPYAGRITAERTRFLVLTKYSLKTLFDSRLLLAFFVACNIPFLFFLLAIYLSHSPAAQALLNMKGAILTIDNFFFVRFLFFQGTLCFLMTSLVGPGLVSIDLSNDALPLYFSRPFSRTEYVLGKVTVLALLLSAITWVPGLILFALQADLAGWEWFSKFYWVSGSIMLGSIIWIALLSLMSLALSGWVKWKIAASALMLGVFFALAGFGEAINAVLRTNWGKLLNLGHLIGVIWLALFRLNYGTMRRDFADLPLWAAWAMLISITGFSLLMLNRRLKAKEVVR
jgi:ABC-2 type transport system permease protein